MATKLKRATSQKDRLRLLEEAVERYLELCRGGGGGVCDVGNHEDDSPFILRPCLLENDGLCHWCQMDAALVGLDWRDIERAYEEQRGGTR